METSFLFFLNIPEKKISTKIEKNFWKNTHPLLFLIPSHPPYLILLTSLISKDWIKPLSKWIFQLAGEGNESAVNLGEWFQYEVDLDIPLLRLPYDEKFLMIDVNTNGALQGSVNYETTICLLDFPIHIEYNIFLNHVESEE